MSAVPFNQPTGGWFAGWCVALLAAAWSPAGPAGSSSGQWHPAAWVAEALVRRRRLGRAGLVLLAWAAAAVGGSRCSDPFWGRAPGTVAAVLLAPLPWYALRAARAAARDGIPERIFYDHYRPVPLPADPGEDPGEPAAAGPAALVFFYLDAADWAEVYPLMGNDPGLCRGFVARYRWLERDGALPAVDGTLAGPPAVPAVYRASWDEEFLGYYESLGLYRFVIHPGNPKAVQAVAEGWAADPGAPPGGAARPGPEPGSTGSVTPVGQPTVPFTGEPG